MADSSDIDNAIVAHLGSDATLLALIPNGVYFDEAPDNSTRYVIVSLVDEEDRNVFNGRDENALYNVEVFMRKDAGGNPKAAYARVHVLLQGATLTIPGYTLMTLHRESRDRSIDRDEVDSSIVWYRRSGMYRLQAAEN